MSKQRDNSRGYSLRKVNIREIKQRFLIVCEGVETEPNYFRGFRVPTVKIEIQGLGKNPSNLIKTAKDLNDKEEYDQVWCVFDRDSWTKQDFNNAISNAESQGFAVAYSNEAFELWYVLHFQPLNSGISRSDYSQKLTSLLGKNYQKNSPRMYDDLLDKQTTAIKNAEKLLEQYDPHNPEKDNPSTTVHRLVKELNRFIR
ncbi:RloB family protein [Microcoleus sp. FACHB-68]|uniref:RloB family protein n=1 Tax=Microcoleus sp. FACHB-68 TaxID=2692826 RepID=UPI0016821000|nr:RloB family protein [Microcoleus sp. FACHB-68]MBD1935728.1 RloB domain-containing protein [Microcoleus sp. FACHB-68]